MQNLRRGVSPEKQRKRPGEGTAEQSDSRREKSGEVTGSREGEQKGSRMLGGKKNSATQMRGSLKTNACADQGGS